MWAIKEYKELLAVQLKDWTILHTEKTSKEFNEYYAECVASGMPLYIDWVTFDRFDFKRADPARMDDLEYYIAKQPHDIRRCIKNRQAEKLSRAWTSFSTIEEVDSFIKSLDDQWKYRKYNRLLSST